MSEESYKEAYKEAFPKREMMQDSYTEKTEKGQLKVYLDLQDLKTCEEKLKNFFKVKRFIGLVRNAK